MKNIVMQVFFKKKERMKKEKGQKKTLITAIGWIKGGPMTVLHGKVEGVIPSSKDKDKIVTRNWWEFQDITNTLQRPNL